MKKLSFEMLPSSWEYCFNEHCAQHETCIRWHSTKVIPGETISVRSVTPQAAALTDCPYYREMCLVNMAWGFNSLFLDVKQKDCKDIRSRMREYFGCRTAYYNHHYGKKKLTPEQQKDIMDIFRSFGYADDIAFDNYSLEYKI